MGYNCLTYCLDQWLVNKDFVIYYNSNHAVIIEPGYAIEGWRDDPEYLTLDKYGYDHLVASFNLIPKYRRILKEYMR